MSGNQILTISMITKETLRILINDLAFTKGVNMEYNDQFALSGAKIGDTINIRKPTRYIGRTGQALQVEDQTETSVPLQLNTQFGVDIMFTMKDLTLSMDDFSNRFLRPAVATVANKIDRDGLVNAKNTVGAYVGTPGTTPAAALTYLQAGIKMDFQACPRDNQRRMIVDPNAQGTLVDALKGLFQSSTKIAEQYDKGEMGTALGFNFALDQNVVQHTIGALGGSPVVSASSTQSGPSLTTNGWTASITKILAKGDIITIANVFAVNPQNRQSTGQLQQFVLTADVNSDSSGNATLQLSPQIIPPVSASIQSQYQNVNSFPIINAQIIVNGGAAAGSVTTCNMAYHRDAFTLGCADLEMPRGVDMAARVSDKQTGMSIRMVRMYDINNDRMPCRLDVLYGWATLYQELACQVRG